MTAQVHFCLDENDKKEFKEVLKKMDLHQQKPIAFLQKTIEVNGMPFEFFQPNQHLKDAINSQNYAKLSNPEKELKWLNN